MSWHRRNFSHSACRLNGTNFHREVSLTLLRFYAAFHNKSIDLFPHFCYNFSWIVLSKNRINFETNCCKTSNILQQFFCTQNRKELKKWQTENAPILCNFISMMTSSISLMKNLSGPAWKANLLSYANSFCTDMSMTWITAIWEITTQSLDGSAPA